MFYLEGEEIKDPNVIMTDIILINNLYVHVLFDLGATHLFVNPKFANKIASNFDKMDIQLCMTTSLGAVYQTNVTFKNRVVNVDGRIILTDLV